MYKAEFKNLSQIYKTTIPEGQKHGNYERKIFPQLFSYEI